jgi:starch-binding outer membrane protein, SusD/RagB family
MIIKKLGFFTVATAVTIGAVVVPACNKKFLDQSTVGILTEKEVQSAKGLNQFLVAAYAAIRGAGWEGGASNWVYGSITGGEANKGSDAGDQADIVPIQQFSSTPTNNFYNVKWGALYEGISRCNGTLRIASKLSASDISDADKTQAIAEARFLRGFYHFEAKKMWGNIPYVDESVLPTTVLANTADTWPQIMADFDFARKNLTATKSQIGRANKWAAEAFYGKALLYQQKYAEAKTAFDNVIANGVTAGGVKYGLATNFADLFNADFESATRLESVFAYEASINDGSGGANANFDMILNFPYNGGPGGCCGFFQPSFDFVNSFRVNASGLPFLDNSYDAPANELKTDMGLKSSDPFTPDTKAVDPRLDWTTGRRGIPYLDWGPHPGLDWIRDQNNGGPYAPKKNAYYKAQQGKLTDGTSWTSGLTATNYKIMRFADVLLMAAECEIEVGSLAKAQSYINQVRTRAANQPVASSPATYLVSPYAVPFATQAEARLAVRMERKLELGMEGHRFFDLVRWGIADTEINRVLAYEKTKISGGYGTATFTKNKNELYPIPQKQIDITTSNGKSPLVQNKGY